MARHRKKKIRGALTVFALAAFFLLPAIAQEVPPGGPQQFPSAVPGPGVPPSSTPPPGTVFLPPSGEKVEVQVSQTNETTEEPDLLKQLLEKNPKDIDPNTIDPVVFTRWELTAVKEAQKSRGMARPPTAEELAAPIQDQQAKIKPPPEKREIRLGGIVYKSGTEWMVWINEQIVTPKAIPKEVMDLKVYEEYVEFRWFDEYSNQIYPIRLRPHQRFNIDTRIFLPG
jgi:hypothetical protein